MSSAQGEQSGLEIIEKQITEKEKELETIKTVIDDYNKDKTITESIKQTKIKLLNERKEIIYKKLEDLYKKKDMINKQRIKDDVGIQEHKSEDQQRAQPMAQQQPQMAQRQPQRAQQKPQQRTQPMTQPISVNSEDKTKIEAQKTVLERHYEQINKLFIKNKNYNIYKENITEQTNDKTPQYKLYSKINVLEELLNNFYANKTQNKIHNDRIKFTLVKLLNTSINDIFKNNSKIVINNIEYNIDNNMEKFLLFDDIIIFNLHNTLIGDKFTSLDALDELTSQQIAKQEQLLKRDKMTKDQKIESLLYRKRYKNVNNIYIKFLLSNETYIKINLIKSKDNLEFELKYELNNFAYEIINTMKLYDIDKINLNNDIELFYNKDISSINPDIKDSNIIKKQTYSTIYKIGTKNKYLIVKKTRLFIKEYISLDKLLREYLITKNEVDKYNIIKSNKCQININNMMIDIYIYYDYGEYYTFNDILECDILNNPTISVLTPGIFDINIIIAAYYDFYNSILKFSEEKQIYNIDIKPTNIMISLEKEDIKIDKKKCDIATKSINKIKFMLIDFGGVIETKYYTGNKVHFIIENTYNYRLENDIIYNMIEDNQLLCYVDFLLIWSLYQLLKKNSFYNLYDIESVYILIIMYLKNRRFIYIKQKLNLEDNLEQILNINVQNYGYKKTVELKTEIINYAKTKNERSKRVVDEIIKKNTFKEYNNVIKKIMSIVIYNDINVYEIDYLMLFNIFNLKQDNHKLKYITEDKKNEINFKTNSDLNGIINYTKKIYKNLEFIKHFYMNIIGNPNDDILINTYISKYLNEIYNGIEFRKSLLEDPKPDLSLYTTKYYNFYIYIDNINGKNILNICFASEYLEYNLYDYNIKCDKKININSLINEFKNLYKSLVKLHNKKVYHRDIKPQNILVDIDSNKSLICKNIKRLLFIDFGSALIINDTVNYNNIEYNNNGTDFYNPFVNLIDNKLIDFTNKYLVQYIIKDKNFQRYFENKDDNQKLIICNDLLLKYIDEYCFILTMYYILYYEQIKAILLKINDNYKEEADKIKRFAMINLEDEIEVYIQRDFKKYMYSLFYKNILKYVITKFDDIPNRFKMFELFEGNYIIDNFFKTINCKSKNIILSREEIKILIQNMNQDKIKGLSQAGIKQFIEKESKILYNEKSIIKEDKIMPLIQYKLNTTYNIIKRNLTDLNITREIFDIIKTDYILYEFYINNIIYDIINREENINIILQKINKEGISESKGEGISESKGEEIKGIQQGGMPVIQGDQKDQQSSQQSSQQSGYQGDQQSSQQSGQQMDQQDKKKYEKQMAQREFQRFGQYIEKPDGKYDEYKNQAQVYQKEKKRLIQEQGKAPLYFETEEKVGIKPKITYSKQQKQDFQQKVAQITKKQQDDYIEAQKLINEVNTNTNILIQYSEIITNNYNFNICIDKKIPNNKNDEFIKGNFNLAYNIYLLMSALHSNTIFIHTPIKDIIYFGNTKEDYKIYNMRYATEKKLKIRNNDIEIHKLIYHYITLPDDNRLFNKTNLFELYKLIDIYYFKQFLNEYKIKFELLHINTSDLKLFKKIDILNKEELLSHIKMDLDKYNMIKDIYDPHFINNFYDFDTFFDIYTKIKPDYSKYKDIIYQKIELEGAASGTAQTKMPDTSFMRKSIVVAPLVAPLVAPQVTARQQQRAQVAPQNATRPQKKAQVPPQVASLVPQVAPQVASLVPQVAPRPQQKSQQETQVPTVVSQVPPQVAPRQQKLAPLVAPLVAPQVTARQQLAPAVPQVTARQPQTTRRRSDAISQQQLQLQQ